MTGGGLAQIAGKLSGEPSHRFGCDLSRVEPMPRLFAGQGIERSAWSCSLPVAHRHARIGTKETLKLLPIIAGSTSQKVSDMRFKVVNVVLPEGA